MFIREPRENGEKGDGTHGQLTLLHEGTRTHALALALSRVRTKITADCTKGVCLELVPWDLGLGSHREDEVAAGGSGYVGLSVRERTTVTGEQTRTFFFLKAFYYSISSY